MGEGGFTMEALGIVSRSKEQGAGGISTEAGKSQETGSRGL